MSDKSLSLGFSPCPNDTFIFDALVHGQVADPGLDLAEPVLADVETLNEWAIARRLDVTKLSFHAFGHVIDDYVILNAGSALGRGCGPLLVAGADVPQERLAGLRIAIPGLYTTAAMLLRLYAPECLDLVPMRFDLIMPAITAGKVDAGVIIHESRFTYRDHGLLALQDLGEWWERVSGCPIPLGGIAARRSLGEERLLRLDAAVRKSVEAAFAYPERSAPYVRAHAQELDETVIRSHIELYVNEHSLDLGREGRQAVSRFLEMGREKSILPPASPGMSPFLPHA